MSPLDRRQARWTQLHSLALKQGTTFAAIANGLIDPECGALPVAEAIAQLEEMLTRAKVALPAPEPEPVKPAAAPPRIAGGSEPGEYERLAVQLQPAYREAIERRTQDPMERATLAREILEQPAPTAEPAPRPTPIKAVSHKRAAPVRTGRHPKRHNHTKNRRLALDTYNENFYAVPRSFTPEILAALPRTALLGFIKCCNAADSDGVFAMSAKQMGAAVGKSERTGAETLGLLTRAGLIHLVNSGGNGLASIYKLAPYVSVDPAKVIPVLTQAKHMAGARLDALAVRA